MYMLTIHGSLTFQSLSLVLDYIYGAEVQLSIPRIKLLLPTADYLQVTTLMRHIVTFLKCTLWCVYGKDQKDSKHLQNLLDCCLFLEAHCLNLYEPTTDPNPKATRFKGKSLRNIIDAELGYVIYDLIDKEGYKEVMSLPKMLFIAYIQKIGKTVDQDYSLINAKSEKQIYDNVCWWLAVRGNKPSEVEELIPLVNFYYMSISELHSLVGQMEFLPFREETLSRIMSALDYATHDVSLRVL